LTANAIVVDVRIQGQVDVGSREYSDKAHLNIGGSQLVAHQIVSIDQSAAPSCRPGPIRTTIRPSRKSAASIGKEYVYPDQLAWPGIATLPGLPSTAIPTGFAPDGLPVGVQMVGPWLEDPTPLKLAELLEREFGGFVPPKMFDD
jgi:Asp-tRNA(Asn)/Glu-tRNA(Gln) amidotransferase A subunit family amidase